MAKEKFTDSKRFVFRRETDGRMYLEDMEGYFEDVELSDRLAEYLSSILWEHIQMIDEKENGLFELNNLANFVKSNKDLGDDILIALINTKQGGRI